MKRQHAVVWIDHREAHILGVDGNRFDVEAHQPIQRVHHKAGPTAGSGHEAESKAYLDEVARALGEVEEILITGPAQAKLHLFKHLQNAWPQIAQHVVGLESADHPGDAALLKHAKLYFHKVDSMRPQVG
jgi:stalled ribosome rescue protein Dom34